MAKKPNQSPSPIKASKQLHHHEKKQPAIKTVRPKVFITHPSRFKNLVQQQTGNGNVNGNGNSPVSSPISPPQTYDHPHAYNYNQDQDYMSSFNSSRNSSCFSTPLEGSPEYMLESNSFGNSSQQVEFSWEDLEMLLKDMEPVSYGYDHHDDQMVVHQQEVCVYDYDLSSVL